MKALVTGATGFIGSSIVRELLKDNVEVRVTVREKSDTRNIDGLDIERVRGDIRDGASMAAALKGVDVYYQAAALFTFYDPEKLYYDVNVEGAKTALDAALKAGVPKVVFTSSVASVGSRADKKPADETTAWNFEYLGLPYITTKYLGERAALEFVDRGLPLVVVNPTMVIGVRDRKPTPSGEIIVKTANGQYPTAPAGGSNYVDVEDVARGHILAAQKGKTGERYILGNTNLTYKDFMKLIGEVAGVKTPDRVMPTGLMVGFGYVCQAISAVTRKPPVASAKSARFACEEMYFDGSKAVRELGMPQTPLRTTVAKAVSWFRENGYVKAKSAAARHHS